MRPDGELLRFGRKRRREGRELRQGVWQMGEKILMSLQLALLKQIKFAGQRRRDFTLPQRLFQPRFHQFLLQYWKLFQ
ncbi:hypothetical protein BG74_05755 [Sodalis-like endosymbiont of Proechinophthirus fluctus]|nr:hypothetical protein BG74_05755 [Sodalis-like endosymbiont of Proechinophthirus fluctus]